MLENTPETNKNSRTSIKSSNKIKHLKINLTKLTAKSFIEKITWFGEELWWMTNATAVILWDARRKSACRNDLASIWVASLLHAYDKLKLYEDDTGMCEKKLRDVLYLVGVEMTTTNMLELKHENIERSLLTPKEELAAMRFLEKKFE